jgi:DmsE family decaheme c-type cytochrome
MNELNRPALTSLLLIFLFAGGVLFSPSQMAQGPGPETCAICHAQAHQTYLASKHSMKGDARTPAANGGCAACHGDGSEHVKAGGGMGVGGIKNPGSAALAAEEKNALCLTCHESGARIYWQGSSHDRSRVACVECHKVHATRDQVLVKQTQAGVCFSCHKDTRADIYRFTSHPLREGWMTCSSCHNAHGSVGEHELIKNTVNETCYTCHAEKRGPFLWEHPPARENCGECHNPHGANNEAMLKVRGPYLCQQCHMAQFHASGFYDSADLPPNTGNLSRMLGQNCYSCHPKVHGSNHPSGARFTR